jgi:menaquinone-specific isochorismate synthase
MERLSELLETGRHRAELRDDPTLVSFSQPLLEVPDPIDLFATTRRAREPAIFWAHPEAQFWFVGIGEAVSSRLEGKDVLRRASRIRRDVMRDAVVEGPGLPGTGPTFMGAFRFDSGTPQGAPWDELPASLWVLPQTLIAHSPGGTWVTVNALVSRMEDVDQTLLSLEAGGRREGVSDSVPRLLHWEGPSRERWTSSVDRILRETERGELQKATLARHLRLSFDRPWPVRPILHRLSESYPECRVFALARGESCFVGATPEVLIRQEKRHIHSICLAGSAPRDPDHAVDDVAARIPVDDEKERREHEIVVRWIADRLEPLTSKLSWNTTPRLLRLRAVQHLETVFEGTIPDGRDALELLAAIHPTPAVAGKPLEAALRIVREEEELDRGWYAGPIGWMERGGEGEMGLGIRSALIRGSDVHLFAGAGIVQGSDPDKEWRETELKFTPLLSALGFKEGLPGNGPSAVTPSRTFR